MGPLSKYLLCYYYLIFLLHLQFFFHKYVPNVTGPSQTWKTWKKAYILDNSGKTWNMSLKNNFSWKTIMIEGKTQGNYFSLIIFFYILCFLICSKIIQLRKFVCAL